LVQKIYQAPNFPVNEFDLFELLNTLSFREKISVTSFSSLKMKKITIAIDGYSSCGKSTLAKALAHDLHYIFIDSGAMYRGVTHFALTNGIISNGKLDKEALIKRLNEINIQFGPRNQDESHPLFLNSEDITEYLRGIELSSWVSEVAAIREVRKKLVSQQQAMGLKGGVIMDGRDIGTVVFPNAELKIFLTASPDVRTERRYSELIHKGDKVSREEVKANLLHRDHIDTTRAESPLTQAHDAIVIDNSNLTVEDQLEMIKTLIKQLTPAHA
jgi:CMP/dCMP kinase